MAISTLVLALTGGGGGTVTPPSPPPAPSDKGGLREWVKKHLKSLGRLLARLAGKAAAALPGIIGSIVSWLLGTLGKAAGWVGQANRELQGLKLAMTRKQDELVNNLAKLSELDDVIPGIKDHIARERTKLTETEDEGHQQEIQKRITALERELADKELEREARLEAASIIKEELRSQLSRIRETMTRVLEGDKNWQSGCAPSSANKEWPLWASWLRLEWL